MVNIKLQTIAKLLGMLVILALGAAPWPVGAAPPQEVRTLGEAVFRSVDSSHEDVSTIDRLVGGLLLGADRIVLADGSARTLHFVNIRSGDVTTVGGRGEGPREFTGMREIGRTSGGGVFVDNPRGRVTAFAADGSLADVVSYNPISFRGGVWVPRAIGVHSDGAVVFQDGDPMFNPRPDGPYRPLLAFIALAPDGSRTTIAEAPGLEQVRLNYGPTSYNTLEKPFAYSSLAASLGDLVLVADTESGEAVAYDHDGSAVMSFSFGRGAPVSREDDELWREQKIAGMRESRSNLRLPEDAPPQARSLGRTLLGRDDDHEFYEDAVGNAVAPALARLLVGGDGSVWVQRYAFPGALTTAWQRWLPGGSRPDAIVELPVELEMMDALGDLLLLRTVDELGIVNAIVAPLAPPE